MKNEVLVPGMAPDRRDETNLAAYRVVKLGFTAARDFVTRWHYAKGMHNGPTLTCGLVDTQADVLVGVLAFATPCSERVRTSVFGEARKASVTELHRLVAWDVTPRNAESWFIARSLELLKIERPGIEAVVSFADEGRGHRGTIYQASNAHYYGTTVARAAYLDPLGRLRHRRQCGHNVSEEEAREKGWEVYPTGVKHRYCLLTPDNRRHARQLHLDLRIENFEYPKPLAATNGAAVWK